MSIANLAAGVKCFPDRFVPGYDSGRAEMMAKYDAWGYPLPVPKPVPAPVIPEPLPPIMGGLPTDFDITKHDATITAYDPTTGIKTRFVIETQSWKGQAVRVVSIVIDGIAHGFAFADWTGIHPWSSSKCPVSVEDRAKHKEFLEGLNGAVGNGVLLTIVAID